MKVLITYNQFFKSHGFQNNKKPIILILMTSGIPDLHSSPMSSGNQSHQDKSRGDKTGRVQNPREDLNMAEEDAVNWSDDGLFNQKDIPKSLRDLVQNTFFQRSK